MELLFSAVVGAVAAVLSIFAAAKFGVDTQRNALINALKDRIALILDENAELKRQVELLSGENELLRIRVERLQAAEDRRWDNRRQVQQAVDDAKHQQ